MKHFIALSLAIAFASLRVAHGQGFSLQWQTLDASVCTSSGDAYSLTGAIGQPGAGTPLVGDAFSLAGGVTSLAVAVREDDGPSLRIEPRGATLLLAWPTTASGFQLQQSSSLINPSWSDVLVAPATVGSENQIALPFATGHRFFRLYKP